MITAQDALRNGSGLWRTFTCPAHPRPDVNPSARINSRTGKWVCMSCGAKGHIDTITIDPTKMAGEILTMFDEEEITPKTESWFDQYDMVISDFWRKRYSFQSCRLYRLGMDTKTGQPCYPARDEYERIVGVIRRNDGDGPKYLYPKGFRATTTLWGMRELSTYYSQITPRVLVLTEGATDVVAARDAGFDAVSTYGSVLHPAQVSLIKRLSPARVLIAYDKDEAGARGASQAYEALSSNGFFTSRVRWCGDAKDLSDLTVEERRETLGKALESSLL